MHRGQVRLSHLKKILTRVGVSWVSAGRQLGVSWVSAGRPLNTVLHRIMKRTRNVYHLQIRKCKIIVNILKKNMLLNACVNEKWTYLPKSGSCGSPSPIVANVIDGITKDIPNHFTGIYGKLYNSVGDKGSLSTLYHSINEKKSDTSIDDAMKATSSIVREAVNRLKGNKRLNIPFHISSNSV